jgi:FAD/FMN-containing dehydrogenase
MRFSVNGGPLINLSQMNKINYNLDTEIVKVGPGSRWQDLVLKLSQYNRNVVAARVGHVGVSGLLLGGGLGFQSPRYGWSSTHVVEYEVVLANGTVTKASRDLNKDLYSVLQGGGNSFGIVTEISLKTIPLSPVG